MLKFKVSVLLLLKIILAKVVYIYYVRTCATAKFLNKVKQKMQCNAHSTRKTSGCNSTVQKTKFESCELFHGTLHGFFAGVHVLTWYTFML
jgi:hypothetical protein